jgi:ABC-type uncharacterized transport system YnjBCD substrate-binding protein
MKKSIAFLMAAGLAFSTAVAASAETEVERKYKRKTVVKSHHGRTKIKRKREVKTEVKSKY